MFYIRLKTKLANFKKNTIFINVDSGINMLQEELVRFNRYLKNVDKAEGDSFSLLKSIEDTFGELKHFRLEAFCSTKKMLKGITGDITLTACIKVRMDRLNMLRELCLYAERFPESRILYFSSSEIFGGQRNFPGYEYDKPIAESRFGKFNISAEKILQEQ